MEFPLHVQITNDIDIDHTGGWNVAIYCKSNLFRFLCSTNLRTPTDAGIGVGDINAVDIDNINISENT